MSARKLVWAMLLSSILVPSGAWSLGLGDITVYSALNQPLRAEITLLSVAADELDNMRVSLASQETFKRVGIERPFVLSQLQFRPTHAPDGSAVIEITSRQPVREPFLNFLVEAEWPNGRLLREYTVLLDPPTFMDQRGGVIAQTPVVAPEIAAPAGLIAPETPTSESARADEPAQTISAPTTPAGEGVNSHADTPGSNSASTTYNVAPGDTLYQIARQYRHDDNVRVAQVMLAILRANPDAFSEGNINNLKAGAILRIPADRDINAIDAREAMHEVTRQNEGWRAYRAQLTAAVSSQQSEQGSAVASSDGASHEMARTDRSQLETQNTTTPDSPDQNAAQSRPTNTGRLEIMASDQARAHAKATHMGSDNENGQADAAPAQELAQSRQIEIESLNSKVAQLETMLAKQKRIISLQSKALARLQQRVGKSDYAASAQAPQLAANRSAESSVKPPSAAETTAEHADQPMNDSSAMAPAVKTDETAPQESAEPLSSPLRDIFANPAMLAGIGAGALLLLALIWLVVRRAAAKRAQTIDLATYQEDGGASVHAESQAPPLFNQEAGAQTDAETVMPNERTATGDSMVTSAESATVARAQTVQHGQDEAREGALGDDTLAEADVYIAYGLYQQAEDLLTETIKQNPDNEHYRLKLLEAHYAGKNAAGFDTEAHALYRSSGGRPGVAWERVVAMGRELSPGNPLFTGAVAGAPGAQDWTPPETPSVGEPSTEPEYVTEIEPEVSALSSRPSPGSSDVDSPADSEMLLRFDASDFEATTIAEPPPELSETTEPDDLALDFEVSDLELDDSGRLDGPQKQGQSMPTVFDDLSADLDDASLGSHDEEDDDEANTSNADDIESPTEELDDATLGETLVKLLDEPASDDLEALSGDNPVSTKLDLAKVYIDMGDADGALSTLEEVLQEGDDDQRREAHELMRKIA